MIMCVGVLDLYFPSSQFVDNMREEVEAAERECEAILTAADLDPLPITQAWLNGSEQEREAIVTETKMCRANAAFQAQAIWYPWRLENTYMDLDRATAIRQDLQDVSHNYSQLHSY